MSHQDVARVTMRMLHDPVFAAAVADGSAELPLLTAQERSWIRAVDARAWGVDPLRSRRVLKALVDEFKGSALLAMASTRAVATLDAFFQSDGFHQAVQSRGSLADGFAEYLATVDASHLPAVLALEHGLARARRELDSTPTRLAQGVKGPWRARAAGVLPLELDGAALDTLNVLEAWLFEDQLLPGLSLVQDAPGLPPLPELQPERPLRLIAHPTSEGVRLANHGRLVFDVLTALETPRALSHARDDVAALGVPKAAAAGLLDDLVHAGLLVAGSGR